jgi:hypothetical protein
MGKSKSQPGANFIKTSFNQVTVADLLAIEQESPRGIVAALSSLTPRQAARLTETEVLVLYEIVSFIDDPLEIALALPTDWQPPEIDVAAESFEKAELAKIKMGQFKAPYRLLPALAGVYLGEPDLTSPAAPLLAAGAMILEQLTELFKRFKDLVGEEPTDDQKEAGIEALHTFGPYAIVEGIADKYKVRPYEVFKWSAEEVYLELTYQLAKSRYQENLRDIERRQTPKAKK